MKSSVRILVCDPINDEGIQKLRQVGFTIDAEPRITADELMKNVKDYDALIVRGRTKVTREIIDAGSRLKVIGRAGVGLENIDLEIAERRGLKVLNTPEAPAQAVAELTLGLILSLARSISRADHAMKDKKWIKDELMGWELIGKTLGTVGLGKIGERVARCAKAFGMHILITKRTPPDPSVLKELEAEFVPFDDLLSRSDVVTIHVPYTSQTRHMIDERALSIIRKGAYLINTSRGPIMDEKALLKALQEGRLSGAALDVYEIEPPTDWSLVQLPNVISTPHIGAQTYEAQRLASVLLAEKIISSFS